MSAARVIAIDGAAGSGKSTLARGLARALALAYVNTGLMYRALTLEALERGVDPGDAEALVRLMKSLRFALDDGMPPELSIEGSPPRIELEGAEVEAHVSEVARHTPVRTLMRDAQRRLGADGAVMEGRDIATVVFPDAACKFYLTADPGVRARRRALERGTGQPAVADAMQARDRKDARVNRFEPDVHAFELDTSGLTIDQTVDAAMALIRAHVPELL